MKKLTVLAVFLLMAGALAGQTGSAFISPAAISPAAYHPVININYSPGTITAFTSGSIELDIPSSFNPAPITYTSAANLTAVIMAGGVTQSVVAGANIYTSGYAVTVTALTLSADQTLVVTYGNTGAGGVYPPSVPGIYYFHMSEKRDSVSSFAQLDQQPALYITYITIDKSSPAVSVKAGDTVTYYINFRNLDLGNNLSQLAIWDTLPQGMSLLFSNPAATVTGNNVLSWGTGSVSAGTSSNITIVAQANPGIINFGTACVNSASASAINPAIGTITNSMDAKKAIPVTGVILNTTVSAFPSGPVTNQNITLVMGITNAGNVAASMVSGTPQVLSAGGNAAVYFGPSPNYVSSLNAGSTAMFTWVYRATSAGAISFSGSARGLENSSLVTSAAAFSNNVLIIDPTPTYTSTSLPTATAIPPTNTPVPPTDTFTPQATVPASTATPVNTQQITPVSTAAAATPTPEPAIPEKVRTDRNYINLSSGDRVEIKYTVESYGTTYIRIYNLLGEEIRRFYELTLAPGTYSAYWDGTNKNGSKVGKGIYFIDVTQPGGRTIKKIAVTK